MCPLVIDEIEIGDGNQEALQTYDLLEKYKERHPDTEFLFVGGTDLV